MMLFIISILKAQTVNVSALSFVASPKGLPASVYKRFLRFLYHVRLEPMAVIACICAILRIDLKGKIILIMDRTYWMYGKSHQNFLYLAIMYKGYAIPIDFILCSQRKKGHCSFEDRKTLVDRFVAHFGAACIDYVVADREFMGTKWLQYLQKQNIRFVQRLKETSTLIRNQKGQWCKIKDLAADLQCGEAIYVSKRRVIKAGNFESHVTILKTPTGEIVALAHSEEIEDPCHAYRFRWCIEVLFRSLKSNGLNMEETSITDTDRLDTLYRLVMIASAYTVLVGENVAAIQPIKIKTHGYKAVCIMKAGLQAISAFFSRCLRFYSLSISHIMRLTLKPQKKFKSPKRPYLSRKRTGWNTKLVQ